MKKILAAAVIVPALFLGACGAADTPEPTPTVTVTETATPTPEAPAPAPETTPPPVQAPAPVPTTEAPAPVPQPETTPESTNSHGIDDETLDAIFLQNVRKEYPELMEVSDADLKKLVKDACLALDRGATWADLYEIVDNNSGGNVRFEQALVYLFGAGVYAYCPEHSDAMS